MVMTALVDEYGGSPESEARCYRDYESEIVRIRATLSSLNDFRDAVEKFLDRNKQSRRNMTEKISLPELYGLLTFDIKDYSERLNKVIAEQEAEIAKKRTKETA
jgi:hypothetical protein